MDNLKIIWPTWGDLAEDLGAPYPTVTSWLRRGIPARRYRDLIRAAEARGAHLTFDDLEGINAAILGGAQEAAE